MAVRNFSTFSVVRAKKASSVRLVKLDADSSSEGSERRRAGNEGGSEANVDHLSDDEYGRFRLSQLAEAGLWSGEYPARFDRTHTLVELAEAYGDRLSPGMMSEESGARVAGRVDSIRRAGKRLVFVDIKSDQGHLQVVTMARLG